MLNFDIRPHKARHGIIESLRPSLRYQILMTHTRKRRQAVALASVIALSMIRNTRKKRPRRQRSRKPTKYRRAALLRPLQTTLSTSWNQIISCGVDDDFLVSTNFTKHILLENMLPLFELEREKVCYGSPFRCGLKIRGRKPSLHTVHLLVLALWYVKVKRTIYSLCPVFGVTDSTIGGWLDFSLEVLRRDVMNEENVGFGILRPTFEEMKESSSLLARNRIYDRLLEGVLAITDGGQMPCADHTDTNLKNAYFEGFIQGTEAKNLFVFNFFGKLIHAAINYPGSWNDTKSAMVSGFYLSKLSDKMTPPGMAILGDSAFVKNTRITNRK